MDLESQGSDENRELLFEQGRTAALDQWNDADERNLQEVLAAVDDALAILNGNY